MRRIEKTQKQNKTRVTAVENVISKHVGALVQGSQVLANPTGFIGSTVLQMLGKAGPYGAAVVAAISAIIVTPEIVKQIVALLAQKGGPLNRDWRRSIETEVNSLFSVEEKKRRLLGIDGFIVSQTGHYEPQSGSTSYNSKENVNELRIHHAGQSEKAVGIR